MFSKDFFSQSEKEVIKSAIANAELNTSGEIRVHIDNKATRNGVLPLSSCGRSDDT